MRERARDERERESREIRERATDAREREIRERERDQTERDLLFSHHARSKICLALPELLHVFFQLLYMLQRQFGIRQLILQPLQKRVVD